MYSLENKEQSLFREDTCKLDLDFFLGERRLNNGSLFFFIGSEMDVVRFSNRSVTKVSYCCFPNSSAWRTEETTAVSMMSLVSSLSRSSLSSRNGLPISSITSTRLLTCWTKVIWELFVCSWWRVSSRSLTPIHTIILSIYILYFIIYYLLYIYILSIHTCNCSVCSWNIQY